MRPVVRWGLGAASVLVALGVMAYAVGSTLPVEHLAASGMRYPQPADTVWAHVRDLSRYGDWWPDVASTRLLPDPDRREVWQLVNRHDPGFPMEVIESQAPTRLVTRVIDDGLPFGGTWTYEVIPDGAGARLTITEEGRIYNPVFRLMARWFLGYHGTQESYLAALAAHFGESPAIERVR